MTCTPAASSPDALLMGSLLAETQKNLPDGPLDIRLHPHDTGTTK
ncbi:hypothetical protein OHA25_60350 (plasmid) [Nonomuraea sp. NBC_00507]